VVNVDPWSPFSTTTASAFGNTFRAATIASFRNGDSRLPYTNCTGTLFAFSLASVTSRPGNPRSTAASAFWSFPLRNRSLNAAASSAVDPFSPSGVRATMSGVIPLPFSSDSTVAASTGDSFGCESRGAAPPKVTLSSRSG